MEKESFKDMFMFEMDDLIQQLEEIIIESERTDGLDKESVNAVFRIMHTIKGSASMMRIQNVATLAHALEDLFAYFRAENVVGDDNQVIDIVLESLDFIKAEIEKFAGNSIADGDPSGFVKRADDLLKMFKSGQMSQRPRTRAPEPPQDEVGIAAEQNARAAITYTTETNGQGSGEDDDTYGRYKATIFYEEDCGMESLRAFMLVRDLEDIADDIIHFPTNINEEECEEEIRDNGLRIFFDSNKTYRELYSFFKSIVFVERVELIDRMGDEDTSPSEGQSSGVTSQVPDSDEDDQSGARASANTTDAHDVRVAGAGVADKGAPGAVDVKEPQDRQNTADASGAKGREAGEPTGDETQNKEGAAPAAAADTSRQSKLTDQRQSEEFRSRFTKSKVISVSVEKLDLLMNLIGELVISGMIVSQELLSADEKDELRDKRELLCYQHGKIITDLQDTAMMLRMVPISVIFSKMRRVIRDMCRKLDVEVNLRIIGEETEIDKNMLDSIADPLLHLVRNAVDHGTESVRDRIIKGKSNECNMTLEARNVGGDVWILVKDDGQGLDYKKIYEKAYANGLTTKPENEMSEAEIMSFIFKPGFSTSDDITEYSGRGVGLDVVYENVSQIGGSVSVESVYGEGCTFIIKMPTTLVIVGGLVFSVGENKYSLPISLVKECIEVSEEELITDLDGNEAIIIRDECFPVLRLHRRYKIDTQITKLSEGILIVIDDEHTKYCLFVDKLIGEQQVVVKSLPKWVRKKVKGISGCTLLGDGSISLILEPASLIE